MELAPLPGQWDEEGRYTPSEAEVEQGMKEWHMTEGQEVLVWHWLKRLRENTFLATAMYFAFQWRGLPGVFLCLSTAASTRLSKENAKVENLLNMGGVALPEYLLFDVYFYPDLVFGNLDGFKCPDARHLGNLRDVFDHLCAEARIANWMQVVFTGQGSWLYAGFRRLLQLLGVPVHAEVVSGLSYRRIASLDVFVATHTGAMGMMPPPMALWTASYDDDGITYFPQQDHWWHMPVWRSVGQAHALNCMDYQVNLSIHPHMQRVLSEMVCHARTGDPTAARRIRTLLGHIPPEVLRQGPHVAVLRPLINNDGQRRMLAISDGRIPEDEERKTSAL